MAAPDASVYRRRKSPVTGLPLPQGADKKKGKGKNRGVKRKSSGVRQRNAKTKDEGNG